MLLTSRTEKGAPSPPLSPSCCHALSRVDAPARRLCVRRPIPSAPGGGVGRAWYPHQQARRPAAREFGVRPLPDAPPPACPMLGERAARIPSRSLSGVGGGQV